MLGFGKLHKEIKLGDMNYLLTKNFIIDQYLYHANKEDYTLLMYIG